MTAQQIIARWEALCAAADDPEISDVEWERRNEVAYAFMTSTPRHSRLIREEYARQFPDGPPPGTPGMTDEQRRRIAGYIEWN
jgi:hypothetical protein